MKEWLDIWESTWKERTNSLKQAKQKRCECIWPGSYPVDLQRYTVVCQLPVLYHAITRQSWKLSRLWKLRIILAGNSASVTTDQYAYLSPSQLIPQDLRKAHHTPTFMELVKYTTRAKSGRVPGLKNYRSTLSMEGDLGVADTSRIHSACRS